MSRRWPPRAAAFTLIELLLVLVVVAVILGFSLPDFKRARQGFALRSGADSVVYAMRYARSRSVADNVVLNMVMEPEAFQLKEPLPVAGGDDSDPGLVAIPGRMGRRMVMPSGVQFKGAPAGIVFRPDGQVDQVRFSVTGDKDTFIVSTQEIPGHVILLEETAEPEE